MLPKNEKVDRADDNRIKLWIYGQPMSGKTVFANRFPDALMLNTDGNTEFIDSPDIRIKDQIKVTGRITEKTLAWKHFLNVISDLENVEGNTFETIVLDLVEDLYQYCRLYIYDRENVEHESDNSFKLWDVVTNEFLNAMRRLLLLDYNFVLISHEDTTRDITNTKGDNITQIKPNIRDKVALKLSGMVHVVGRLVVKSDGKRELQFKQNEVTFGGYRLPKKVDKINLEYEELEQLYKTKKEND